MENENTIDKEFCVAEKVPELSGKAKRMLNLNRNGRTPKKDESGDAVWPITVLPAEQVAKCEIVSEDGVAMVFNAPASLQNVLSAPERKLYEGEVRQWLTSHPEWNLKEDHDDIHMIAMEKVMQYRLLSDKKKNKKSDVDKEYHASVMRMQEFRKNLAARRVDRIARKTDGGSKTLNIAIIAGKIDRDHINRLGMKSETENREEDTLFPKS